MQRDDRDGGGHAAAVWAAKRDPQFVDVVRRLRGVAPTRPFPRLTWQEAMDRFGTDKPDIRYIVHYQAPASLERYLQEDVIAP